MPIPMPAGWSTTQITCGGWKWLVRIGWSRLELPLRNSWRQGILFAVVRVEIDYHLPAVLGDEVEITVEPDQVRRVRFTLRQNVYRCSDAAKLVSAKITVACLTPEGKISSVPQELRRELSRPMPPGKV